MTKGVFERTLSDVLADLEKRQKQVRYVVNWRAMIPPGSRWFPGDPGDPACRVCHGTGYVRLDVPIGHPLFGRLIFCDCVRRKRSPSLAIAEAEALQEQKHEAAEAERDKRRRVPVPEEPVAQFDLPEPSHEPLEYP